MKLSVIFDLFKQMFKLIYWFLYWGGNRCLLRTTSLLNIIGKLRVVKHGIILFVELVLCVIWFSCVHVW